MATKVPISVENIAFERLNLSRHYLTIDCDFTCYIVLNPSGNIPSEGTDICALHTGAWQIDAWSLLTKKDFPNQAGFIACLVWDRMLVTDTARAPSCIESDIDTANSVSSLKGQPVNVTSFSLPAGESLPASLTLDESPVSALNRFPVELSAGDIYKVRGSSLFFERFEKNVTEIGDRMDALKAFVLRTFHVDASTVRLTLRPRYASCNIEHGVSGFCYCYPWYFTYTDFGNSKFDVCGYMQNVLLLDVGIEAPYLVKKITYVLRGVSIKAGVNLIYEAGGEDLPLVGSVEF